MTETWGCVDRHTHTLLINMLGRQDTTTASVDHLRQEFVTANDVGLGSALAGINSQLRALAKPEGAQIAHSETPKQLTVAQDPILGAKKYGAH